MKKSISRDGMINTKVYRCWQSMKQRCLNKNDIGYKNYGGRGITVCPEWLNSFKNFYADMGKKPEGLSLDRIDNDGNYCKENCRWATLEEQHNNTRANRFLTYNNKTQTMAQWAREFNISSSTLFGRIKRTNNRILAETNCVIK